jgi:hypothetical protein
MMENKSLFNPKLMSRLDATQVGRIGEHLVTSMIAGYGYNVHHADGNGYDILAMIPKTRGKVIRIDVKTRKSAEGNRQFSIRKGKTTAFREYESDKCDLFALVCLEDQSVTFKKCSDYEGKNFIYLNAQSHKTTDPHESWVGVLETLDIG